MSLTILPNSLPAMIEHFEAIRATLIAERDCMGADSLDKVFVIQVGGLVLDIDRINSNGTMNAVVPVRDASTFLTFAAATRWADRIFNGKGERASVWSVRQAYNDSIFRIEDVLTNLRRAA